MPEPETKSNRPGGVVFAALFLILSLLLLSQIVEQTKFSSKTLGTRKMFAQPAFWPFVGVAGMVLFGALHLIGVRRAQQPGEAGEALFWLRPLEYLGWFMAYVFAVPVIGYLPASLIFAFALACRAGYRSKRMLTFAALTGLSIVLIFKTILSVKIPGGDVYELLPDAARNFAIVNF